MQRKTVTAWTYLAAGAFVAAPFVGAQTASEEDPDVFVLSPFLVEASEDEGYLAGATLAGTRIRTDLKDVGSAISVVTEGFLRDTNSTNAESLLVYTTNTEVAGQGGNFLGQGDGAVLTNTNRRAPVANTRVRGLTEADNTRDYFLSDIPWDSYNVGRVDLQRGPNSILFGIGSPAGIVNAGTNAAAFENAYKLENRLDNFGTVRFSGDFNQVVIEKELAVRLSLLNDSTKYRQHPAYRDDQRVYGAVNYTPKMLNTDSMTTQIRANYERGTVDSNMPRQSPPLDAINPWFTEMNKGTYSARTANDAADTQFWLGSPGNRVYDGVITTFSGGAQGFSYPAKAQPWPDPAVAVPAGVVGRNDNPTKGINTYNNYAGRAGLPFAGINAYKARSLTDSSIFNFYDNLLEGPNKHEWNDFTAANASVAQTFLGNLFGYEFAYDTQDATWGYENFLSGDASVITVDVMSHLLDGSPNPNVGRPFTISGGGDTGGFWASSQRETLRLTTFAEIDFTKMLEDDSVIAKIFGRNVFTGLLSRQSQDFESRNYNRYYLADSFAPNKPQGSVGQASRDNHLYVYLGESLAGASSASDAKLVGIKSVIEPSNSTINVYNNQTGRFEEISLDIHNNDNASNRDKTYRLARKYEDVTESAAFVWQGYWLGNTLIPMVGVRKDKNMFSDAGNPPGAGGLINPFAPSWKLPDESTDVEGISRTYSVVAHLPNFVREMLPGQMDISPFYNESENFQPDSSRRDILGDQVPNPQGETQEYGVTLTMLNDKVSLKWTHYETTVSNATLDQNGIGGQYLIGAVEAWGQRAAYKFKNEPGIWPASTIYGTASDGTPVTWRPAGPVVQDAAGNYAYTQDVIDATNARMQASLNAWFATQVPAGMQDAWALTNYGSASYDAATNFGASGLVVTGSTISEGDEFEVYANLKPGWDLSFNAAKTTAQRTNLAKPYVDWITKRWTEFQGPAGDMRLWGGDDDWQDAPGHTGESARGKFRRETMSGFNLWNALDGADVPELRPWRFNVVSNYSFQSGMLKGTNLGVSYRWQDKSVTGFPVVTNAEGELVYDVNNPYKGKSEDSIDLWVGYETKITDKVTWRTQLNVRNLLASDDLIPVTVQPDGSYAAMRIPEPRTISLSNTISF
jgi:outer membrane receptor protein involved in Fe transport